MRNLFTLAILACLLTGCVDQNPIAPAPPTTIHRVTFTVAVDDAYCDIAYTIPSGQDRVISLNPGARWGNQDTYSDGTLLMLQGGIYNAAPKGTATATIYVDSRVVRTITIMANTKTTFSLIYALGG